MEMDQNHLKEMGIKKIGDRVRIGSQVKLFRSREFRKSSKRTINRVCAFERKYVHGTVLLICEGFASYAR